MRTDNRVGDAYATRESPDYSVSEVALSLTVAAALMTATIVAMIGFANTIVADFVALLYIEPIIGVAVIGGLLTVGRLAGMKGAKNDNYPVMTFGAVTLVLTYGAFGGAILQLYTANIWVEAIVISGAITTAISLIAGFYVFRTDKNLSHWSKRSGLMFIAGFVVVAVGTVFPPLLIVGFFMFLTGFVFDLIYEIWKVSSSRHTPIANGIGVYVAFAGIFIHVLQLVLEALADD